MEAEGAGSALIGDASPRIDEINTIWPSGIGAFRRVAEVIQNGGHLDAKLAHTCARNVRPLIFILWSGKEHALLEIALTLPKIGGMSFDYVDD